MSIVDAIVYCGLAAVVTASVVFRRSNAVYLIGVIVLSAIIVAFSWPLYLATPRLAASRYERAGGKLSSDYMDGVMSASEVTRDIYPYIFTSAMGLAFLCLCRKQKTQSDA